jgi:hypothetical protein
VYALAISENDIAGEPFSWRQEIVYFGMTNAKGGLKSRLKQFDDTIRGGSGHGGGHRVRFKHRDYGRLAARLFVSVWPFICDVGSFDPADLRIMGEVAKSEYECLARFADEFGCLPEFNDKKRSPKTEKAKDGAANGSQPMRSELSLARTVLAGACVPGKDAGLSRQQGERSV